jgi:hypothetical protein
MKWVKCGDCNGYRIVLGDSCHKNIEIEIKWVGSQLGE